MSANALARRLVRAPLRLLPSVDQRTFDRALTRYCMYSQLRVVLEGSAHGDGPRMSVSTPTVLSVSGSLPLVRALNLDRGRVIEANHPAVDLIALPYRDDMFDAIVADQVLEHVEGDPRRAIAESFRVVRPGGIVVHTTCLLNPLHPSPGDYWRFSPDGLRLLAADFGDVIETGSWGNRVALLMLFAGLRRVRVPEGERRPLHRIATRNEVAWPITTWVVARKR